MNNKIDKNANIRKEEILEITEERKRNRNC